MGSQERFSNSHTLPSIMKGGFSGKTPLGSFDSGVKQIGEPLSLAFVLIQNDKFPDSAATATAHCCATRRAATPITSSVGALAAGVTVPA